MIPVLGVPVLNHPAKLYRLLYSIDVPVHRVLVIDNGDVVNHVTAKGACRSRVDIITPGANLGVAGSWNLVVKANPFAPWWLIVNNDAWFPEGALEQFALAARTDALVLSGGAPPWCAFALGEHVVSTVGLFDEGLFPAYFEDDDYTRRCTYHGIPVVNSGIGVNHENSSTIAEPRYAQANNRTFGANAAYYRAKTAAGDFTPGQWSLDTRRALAWD